MTTDIYVNKLINLEFLNYVLIITLIYYYKLINVKPVPKRNQNYYIMLKQYPLPLSS